EYGDRMIALRYVPQYALHERNAPEIFLVGTQRDFVLRAAVDIVEQYARQTAPRQLTQVRDVCDFHAMSFLLWTDLKPIAEVTICQHSAVRPLVICARRNVRPAPGRRML